MQYLGIPLEVTVCMQTDVKSCTNLNLSVQHWVTVLRRGGWVDEVKWNSSSTGVMLFSRPAPRRHRARVVCGAVADACKKEETNYASERVDHTERRASRCTLKGVVHERCRHAKERWWEYDERWTLLSRHMGKKPTVLDIMTAEIGSEMPEKT